MRAKAVRAKAARAAPGLFAHLVMEFAGPQDQELIDLSMEEEDEDDATSVGSIPSQDHSATPISELKGTALEYSTVRLKRVGVLKGIRAVCIFCGLEYKKNTL